MYYLQTAITYILQLRGTYYIWSLTKSKPTQFDVRRTKPLISDLFTSSMKTESTVKTSHVKRDDVDKLDDARGKAAIQDTVVLPN